jgi:hypothetical protein
LEGRVERFGHRDARLREDVPVTSLMTRMEEWPR